MLGLRLTCFPLYGHNKEQDNLSCEARVVPCFCETFERLTVFVRFFFGALKYFDGLDYFSSAPRGCVRGRCGFRFNL